MKNREFLKWALVAYLVTLAMLILTMRMLPSSTDNPMASFAKLMITQTYPLFVIAPVLAVYSVCVRRWQPILGGLYGNLLFFPFTITFGSLIAIVITGPVPFWREGWHLVAVLSVVAYVALAWLLIHRLIKFKYPNKSVDHISGSR